MATGCYPIQTDTSCANEWVPFGSGSVVDIKSIQSINTALVTALQDNNVVDEISEINVKTIQVSASTAHVKNVAINFYDDIALD